MDLKSMSNNELDQLRIDVLTEQERRANMDAIPSQIAGLAAKYVDGRGNRADLAQALEGDSEE